MRIFKNSGNDLATVLISAFCRSLLSNNSSNAKYKLFLKLSNGSMRKSVFNSLRRFSEKKGVQTWLCQTDERCFSTAVRLFQGMADTLLSMLNKQQERITSAIPSFSPECSKAGRKVRTCPSVRRVFPVRRCAHCQVQRCGRHS